MKSFLSMLYHNFNSWACDWPFTRTDLKYYISQQKINLKGITINAGSGTKNYNIDAEFEIAIDIMPNTDTDIVGDLHYIPLRDKTVKIF